MKSLLRLEFLPLNPNLALLVLRLWLGLSMLLLHGWPKLQKLVKGDFAFADPIGIGAAPSLVLAVTAEAVASVLLMLGILGRLSALFLAVTMVVAFAVSHSMKLSGPGNGELAFIYLAGYVTLLIAGTGKYGVKTAWS